MLALRALCVVFAAALIALSPAPAAAHQDAPRFAVVVGNADYGDHMLPNPINDARAMASALRELDFEVHLIENASVARMKELMRELEQLYTPESVGLFYYAGHAVQFYGENHLLPVDMAIAEPDELPSQSVSVSEIVNAFEAADVGLRIVILDACRDFPYGGLQDVFGAGLANVDATGETLIAYATRAGAVAYDGDGPHSPYTGALVSALELPGRDIYDVFKTVRAKVRQATDGRQIPWVGGSIESDFVFRPEGAEATIRVSSSVFDPAEVHWRTIAMSEDPTDFVRFVRAHPGSAWIDRAEERARLLQAQDLTPLPAPEIPIETIIGSDVAITRCDRLVSDPLDPRRIAPGVAWGLVNTRHAIRDCAAAVAEDPDNPRLNFLFARALDIAERFEEAKSFYEIAAEDGYGAAMRNLGYMHRTGRGVAPDDEKAARYYLDASLLGVLDARKALARLYEKGWGVPKSFEESLRWLRLAADDGYPNAMDHLGNIYREGEGVPQDLDRALAYYRLGAARDYANAVANVGRMYRDGLAVKTNLVEARRLYRRASDLGSPFAPYHLARILLKGGKGVRRDPKRAKALLELSFDRGYHWALWQLARSYEAGDFGRKDPARAMFYLTLAIEAGGALRHESGEKLKTLSIERLETVRARAKPEEIARADADAARWIAENSLFRFALIYRY